MRRLARWGIPALLLALPGCAGTAARPPAPDLDLPRARVALLPLENLTGRADAAEAFTRVLFVELVRKGRFEVVDMGEVEAAMDSMRLRASASLPLQQARALGDRLSVAHVMLGSLLESGMVHTPEGDVPVIGVALKLLEVGSGRLVWAQMVFRSGEDRETVFGWGRERNPQRLAAQAAAQLLADLRIPQPAAPDSAMGGGR